MNLQTIATATNVVTTGIKYASRKTAFSFTSFEFRINAAPNETAIDKGLATITK